MAKKGVVLKIKMEHKPTGEYYMTKKNPKTKTEKLVQTRYSRKLKKHVEFKENAKLK